MTTKRERKLMSSSEQLSYIEKKVERLKQHHDNYPQDVDARLAYLKSLQSLEVASQTNLQALNRRRAEQFMNGELNSEDAIS